MFGVKLILGIFATWMAFKCCAIAKDWLQFYFDQAKPWPKRKWNKDDD